MGAPPSQMAAELLVRQIERTEFFASLARCRFQPTNETQQPLLTRMARLHPVIRHAPSAVDRQQKIRCRAHRPQDEGSEQGGAPSAARFRDKVHPAIPNHGRRQHGRQLLTGPPHPPPRIAHRGIDFWRLQGRCLQQNAPQFERPAQHGKRIRTHLIADARSIGAQQVECIVVKCPPPRPQHVVRIHQFRVTRLTSHAAIEKDQFFDVDKVALRQLARARLTEKNSLAPCPPDR